MSDNYSKERLFDSVKNLCIVAEKYGLDQESIDKGISLMCRNHHIDQSNTISIIHSMIPIAKVSQKTVIRILGSLGHGKTKASLFVQVYIYI